MILIIVDIEWYIDNKTSILHITFTLSEKTHESNAIQVNWIVLWLRTLSQLTCTTYANRFFILFYCNFIKSLGMASKWWHDKVKQFCMVDHLIQQQSKIINKIYVIITYVPTSLRSLISVQNTCWMLMNIFIFVY